MTPIKGSFLDGSTSSRRSAAFSVNDTGQFFIHTLENQADSALYSGNFSQLDVSPRLGNTPRYLYIKNGGNFETNDNDGVDLLLTKHSRNLASRFLHILESHLVIVLIFTVLVMGFMWGGVKYGIPSMAKVIAEHLPAETNYYLGEEAINVMDKVAFQPSELSAERQQELTRLFQTYANDYPEHQITFKFRKGKKGIGVNAFTLPNGTIVFTDEMVNLAVNDHELVAILGHEIGHVVYRHVLRRIIQNSTISILILFITGDISSASSIVLTLPSLLLNLSYSREFEIEADDFAFDFLSSNNIDPDHFSQIMKRLQHYDAEQLDCNDTDTKMSQKKKSMDTNENGLLKRISPYLSTHPDTENRIRMFVNKKINRSEKN